MNWAVVQRDTEAPILFVKGAPESSDAEGIEHALQASGHQFSGSALRAQTQWNGDLSDAYTSGSAPSVEWDQLTGAE